MLESRTVLLAAIFFRAAGRTVRHCKLSAPLRKLEPDLDAAVRRGEVDAGHFADECRVVFESNAVGQIHLTCLHEPGVTRGPVLAVRLEVTAAARRDALIEVDGEALRNGSELDI